MLRPRGSCYCRMAQGNMRFRRACCMLGEVVIIKNAQAILSSMKQTIATLCVAQRANANSRA